MTVTPPPKPKGLLKCGYNMPRYVYHWHLGWLLGHRFLMITHRGRKTGRIRQTILEVAHYDPVTRKCVIGAAYGSRTDWYQNILAHPALLVQMGRQRYVPLQRQLAPEEALTILRDYQQRHPWIFRQCTRLFGFPYDGTDESLVTLSRAIPGMAFRPSQQE